MLPAFLPSSSATLSTLIPPVTSQQEEYSQLKQKLSQYLPHHLLTKPTLGEELNK
jgi:hypothetical protein